MSTPLRVLIVEDSESDVGLIARQLIKADYDLGYERVETAEEMRTALAKQDWELIIADYNLPSFSGPAALAIFKEDGRDIPFIVVSAAIGEETAVGMMKAGAHDYVMKDNLARLVPAVERELREASGRRERLRAEAGLVKSEAMLSLILKGSPTGIGLVVNRVFQWVNDKLLRMTGYSREELIGQSSRLLYHSEAEFNRVGQVKYEQILKVGYGEIDTQLRRKDGSLIEVYLSSVAVDPDDLSAGVIFTAMDITVRKKAERAVRESEQELQSIFSVAPVGIGMSVNQAMMELNEHICHLTGFSRDELLGKSTRIFYASEQDYQEIRSELYRQIRQTGEATVETRWQRKNGSLFDVSLRASALVPGNLDAGVTFTVMDVTEKKQAEEKLRQSEAKYRLVFENVPLGIMHYDQTSTITDCNAKFAEIIGAPKEKFIGFNMIRQVSDDKMRAAAAASLQGEVGYYEGDYLSVTASKLTPVRAIYQPISSPEGLVLGGVSIFEDITARKQAEAALRESRRQWEEIFQAIGHPTVIMDSHHRILSANRATLAAVGLAKAEVLGRPCYEVFHPGTHQPPAGCPLDRLLISGNLETIEMEMEALGDTFLVSCTPMQNPDGSLDKVIHIATDITAQKRAEAELRLAAQKWRTTFDAMRDAVCLLDREGVIVQCNQAMADLMEQPFSQILGHSCWEVICDQSTPTEDCPFCRLRHSHGRETMTWKQGDRWWQITMDPIITEAGEFDGGVYSIADITVRKLSQDKVHDLNILLKAIKDINEALLRVKSEKELFQHTCDLLLTVPYIRFCWIGLVEPDSFAVNPVTWAGAEEGYLSTIKVAWDDSKLGQGPTGEGLRSGKPVVRRNIATDPSPNPWRQEALQRGYQSSISLPLIHEGLVVGILKVYSGVPDSFGDEEIDFLNQVAADVAVGVKSLRLEQEVIANLIKMQVMMIQTVETIGAILEVRDPYTAGHQRGVSKLSCALGNELGLSADRLEGLRVACLLHDIGKIVVPAEILNRPGKLSEFEMNIIKTHPEAGYEILKKINFPWPVAQVVIQHHERLNGSGYPHGLAERDISLEARILAVADVVEAMASHRPYRPALGLDKALNEITGKRGVHFDPEVVDACIKLFQEKHFNFD